MWLWGGVPGLRPSQEPFLGLCGAPSRDESDPCRTTSCGCGHPASSHEITSRIVGVLERLYLFVAYRGGGAERPPAG